MSFLQLDRNEGERVDILDERTGAKIAEVRVVEVRGHRVRLGFIAEPHIKFIRDDAKVRVPSNKQSENGNGNTTTTK
jgi:sRNA-binding carbon storage regulator CsrA